MGSQLELNFNLHPGDPFGQVYPEEEDEEATTNRSSVSGNDPSIGSQPSSQQSCPSCGAPYSNSQSNAGSQNIHSPQQPGGGSNLGSQNIPSTPHSPTTPPNVGGGGTTPGQVPPTPTTPPNVGGGGTTPGQVPPTPGQSNTASDTSGLYFEDTLFEGALKIRLKLCRYVFNTCLFLR